MAAWAIIAVAVSALLSGCGSGGGSSASPAGTASTTAATYTPLATASFSVNVITRDVTVTPMAGQSSAEVSAADPRPRAVFTGTSIRFDSSILVDQPGNTGLKVLRVALVNGWGATIGVTPSLQGTGLKVVFGEFAIVSSEQGIAISDNVVLANPGGLLPGSGLGANRPYIRYPYVLSPGMESPPREWAFAVPEGVTAFRFTVQVVTDTGIALPLDAVDGNVSGGVGSVNVMVGTVAGSPAGDPGFVDGPGVQARFHDAMLVAADGLGNLYVADRVNHSIRRITPAGMVTTVAGTAGTEGSGNGDGTVAKFRFPVGVAASVEGSVLYVADTENHMIRRIALTAGADPADPANWIVGTIAGAAGQGYADGEGTQARFSYPFGIAVDSLSSGTLYVTEWKGQRVRRLRFTGGDPGSATNWRVNLVAGDNSDASPPKGFVEGVGDAARFDSPKGIAVDREGSLYLADAGNNRVRKIANPGGGSGGTVTTVAGDGANAYLDGSGTFARLKGPWGVAVDAAGFAYFTDTDRIRRVSPSGEVRTTAGTADSGYADGPGNIATFQDPRGIALDSAGNLYASDGGSGARIRLIHQIVSEGVELKILYWDPPAFYTDGTPLDAARELDRFEFYVRENGLFADSDVPRATASVVMEGTTDQVRNSIPLDSIGPFLPARTYLLAMRAVTKDGVKSNFSNSVAVSF